MPGSDPGWRVEGLIVVRVRVRVRIRVRVRVRVRVSKGPHPKVDS